MCLIRSANLIVCCECKQVEAAGLVGADQSGLAVAEDKQDDLSKAARTLD